MNSVPEAREAGVTAAPAFPAARLKGVRKRFGFRDVLRGLTLEIPRGGCFVVTGPNGAGKSTLLRILATEWTATEGELEILGRPVRHDGTAIRSRLGIVFHEPFLRRELTLDENLRFAATLHGLGRAEAESRIGPLLARFSLAHRRHDQVGTFSQGMLKRASLARSLLNRPELWILDEPFSGLDPDGRRLLVETIRRHGRESADHTVVLVTHELELARELATASVRIEDGKVAREGLASLSVAGATTPSPGPELGEGQP